MGSAVLIGFWKLDGGSETVAIDTRTICELIYIISSEYVTILVLDELVLERNGVSPRIQIAQRIWAPGHLCCDWRWNQKKN